MTKRVRRPEGQGLNDLYVRFFRMAERRIAEKTGQGVVCFISNYSWLDGLSFTGMRERYLEAFDAIRIDNLHGDRIISEYRARRLGPAKRSSRFRGNRPASRWARASRCFPRLGTTASTRRASVFCTAISTKQKLWNDGERSWILSTLPR